MLDIISIKLLHSFQLLLGFTYYYPLYMAYLWMLGAIFFYFRYEFGRQTLPVTELQPKVSIVVPCFNEQSNATETISHLFSLNYDNYEIIAVNDGSSDCTGEILEQLAGLDNRLHVIHHARNQGKAVALNTAARLATGQYIIGIDSDALLDADAIQWFLHHFQSNKAIGAVTGNPRIRTRSTLLGRLQVGEFSSLIGLIKRAQKIFYGHLFTASGVISAFRVEALKDVNYWSPDMLTEDMDITWKLQVRGWQVGFEPRALAWILMPETVSGLWQQRLRWAMGGLQIIGKFKSMFRHWRTYPMWPLMFEHLISIVWACSVSVVFATYLFEFLSATVDTLQQQFNATFTHMSASETAQAAAEMAAKHNHAIDTMTALLPEFSGVIIGTTCLLQMLIAVMLDRHYDKKLLYYYFWTIWYPFGFWLINMLTIVSAIPKILLRGNGIRARWISPDRGIQSGSLNSSSRSQAYTKEKMLIKPDAGLKIVDLSQSNQCNHLHAKTEQHSVNSLILDQSNRQPIAFRLLSGCITALGWVFWIYLWLPILESIPLVTGLDSTPATDGSASLGRLLDTLNNQLITISMVIVVFSVWSVLRRLNQSGRIKHLQNMNQPVSITSAFDLSSNRLIVVSHDEQTGLIKTIKTPKQFSRSKSASLDVQAAKTG